MQISSFPRRRGRCGESIFKNLRAFNYLLDSDGKLQIPDFVVHQYDLEHVIVEESSDDEILL